MRFLALAAILMSASFAQAKAFWCSFEGAETRSGQLFVVDAVLDFDWAGYGSIRIGTFSYRLGDQTVTGALDCSKKTARGYQMCVPTPADPILNAIMLDKIGIFVQVDNMSPRGIMNCSETPNRK